MIRERQLVSFDWAMKALLREKSNFDILEGFLSELLKEDILIEEILESEGNQEHVKDKFNRVDLLTRIKGGPCNRRATVRPTVGLSQSHSLWSLQTDYGTNAGGKALYQSRKGDLDQHSLL